MTRGRINKSKAICLLTAFTISACATDTFTNMELAICDALTELANSTHTDNTIHTIMVRKEPLSLFCGDTTSGSVKRYCDEVLANTSIEFVNAYPWAIRECLKARGSIDTVTIGDGWTGLRGKRQKKITYISGELQLGAAVSMKFIPEGEDQPNNYYGVYELVVSPVR